MKNKHTKISYSIAKGFLLELLDHHDLMNDTDIKEKIERLTSQDNSLIENESPSRIVIDRKCRVYLPDYSEQEAVMPYLAKTLFLFFLNHPQGLEFRKMHKHTKELYDIYQVVSEAKNMEAERIRNSINNLVNPTNNRIYEVCSLVRKAFLQIVANAEQAEHYCISGQHGGIRRISIDRKLVHIENEKLKLYFMNN
ncbi:hypothetical protein [Bacteroides sp. 51]|uniref:hypothetical protein n=1 Tax=Bacteroides sp. 51 TaxID=2302938 RepID=UPI0013D3926E|nr:hypothetical protein [Bacteroides sp. 51]NDV80517.1 hypothetical protein [Bacteroides sp. 51]